MGKGDKISIAYTVNDKWQNATGDATADNPARIYVSTGLDTGGETAVFNISGKFNATATGAHQFYSVYPSSCVKSTDIKYAPSVTMTIPGVQTPAENSFDAAADLMIGKATKTYNSLSDAKKMRFRSYGSASFLTPTSPSKTFRDSLRTRSSPQLF